ncbi:MAG: serine--tRNA ligase [Thermoprotei archaeon]|nr:serine--tRNA ligase [TACK group archaeon]
MIDVRLLRENPDLVEKDLEKRGRADAKQLVERLVELDKKIRQEGMKVQELRHERNTNADQVARMKAAGAPQHEVEDKVKFGAQIADQIAELEKSIDALKKEFDSLFLTIPNITHESVPFGRSDDDNVEVRRWGQPVQLAFKPRDHMDIGLKLDVIDTEKAAEVSGARFAYLKGDLVMLEFALVTFVMRYLIGHGFTPIIPPVLVKEKMMYGTGFFPLGREDVYKVEGEDLYLAGTAEVPLAGLHSEDAIPEEQLPKYYAGFSSCFRTEAGAHGKDTKGIFRVHQFDKVEMFVYCKPEDSWNEHEKLIRTAEGIYQQLGIPYRVVNVCSSELGPSAAKKYDLEGWLPGQGKYRELVSCSNCTDYQARRLNIKYRGKDGKLHLAHTLNSTATAVGRTLVAILENYQQEDGSVLIPEVLRPLMGKDKITPPR